ncbi:MAG: exosome complex RNA-binding protein Csl4 [Promethearchaeati archaeon SRVP18_Atabeyarchaeia-1]
MNAKASTGDLVVPGDRIGVIEEYVPSEGTYEEGGTIFSSRIGVILVDKVEKKVKVFRRLNKPIPPNNGDIVIGKIVFVHKQVAEVSIARIRGQSLSTSASGLIHISQVSDEYTDSMDSVFKPGDVVRARIVNASHLPYQLSTAGSTLGVLYTLCSRCGTPLALSGSRLSCPACYNVEERKLSLNYGKPFF